MSVASSSCQESYDVFLNFRGKDTRNGFIAHLYEALCDAKIDTFMDDNIGKGKEILTSLVTAIDKSMFCIVVLSENYASSTWCLDELVQILECKNAKEQTVLPIFYNVKPSDVRAQKGTFAKGFAKLEKRFKNKMERVQRWREALTEVANISGWETRRRKEPDIIREIVLHILDELIKRFSKDVEAMVGVYSHLQAREPIPVSNIPALPSIGERREFPLRKRKINQMKETDTQPLTNGEWRKTPRGSTRQITHYFIARDIYTSNLTSNLTSYLTARDLHTSSSLPEIFSPLPIRVPIHLQVRLPLRHGLEPSQENRENRGQRGHRTRNKVRETEG